MEQQISGYCDYLDKEMTIMGLLSAFAMAVPAFVLDRTAGAEKEKNEFLAAIWTDQRALLGIGSLAFVLAALFFYRQRSLLAYYIGQLRLSQTVVHYEGVTAKTLLEDADSWATWVWYQTGFVLITLGFAAYGMTFFASVLPAFPPHTIDVLCVVAAGYALVNAFVMRRNRYQDRPWIDWSQPLRR